jgi:hypothetical protein
VPVFVPFYKAFRAAFLAALLLPFALQAKDPLPDGSQLARSIRELVPEKNMEIRATMEVIVRERKRLNTDVVIQVEKLGQAEWQTTYTAKRDEEISEYWRVSHGVGQLNRYEKKSGLAKGAEIYYSFAGSSFFVADLGMDFLHWPTQVVLKIQRRKSRLCYVLESRNPKPAKGEYHRVVSWVDEKSGGILLADIYTGESKPVKRFAVKGLTKKDGQWQVDEMEMRDTKTGARSRLHFHLK